MNAVEILEQLIDDLEPISGEFDPLSMIHAAHGDGTCGACLLKDVVIRAVCRAEAELQRARLITGDVLK